MNALYSFDCDSDIYNISRLRVNAKEALEIRI
jgi:hypothetical protein